MWKIISLFLVAISVCRAQQTDDKPLDRLKQKLTQAGSDTSKAIVLQKLSDYWIYKDTVKSMDYARKIYALDSDGGSNYIRGIAHYQIGGIYMEYFQLDSAKTHHEKAIAYLEKVTGSTRAKQYLARTWHNYGAIFQRLGEEDTFADILLNKAIPILYSIKDTFRVGIDYISLGEIMMNSDEWKQAEEYFKEGIAILEHYPESEDLPRAYITLARNLMLDKHGETLEQTQKVRECLDQAERYIDADKMPYTQVYYLTNNGMYYHHRVKQMQKALDNYTRGMALAEQYGYRYFLADLAFQRFQLYLDNGQLEEARRSGYECYNIQKQFSIPENWLRTQKLLAGLEERTGNLAEANELRRSYIALSDSINTAEKHEKIMALEKRFETAEREKEILRLEADNQAKTYQRNTARLYSILWAIGCLLFLCAAAFLFYILRDNKRIARQKEMGHQQQLTDMKQKQELKMTQAMLEGEEKERRRIARDLHDGLGGALSGIKIKLSGQRAIEGEPVVEEVIHQLENSIGELRRIARNMMPESLVRSGLEVALRDLCVSLAGNGIDIELQTDGIRRELSIVAQTNIYRIVQELVTNAVRHSDGTKIIVQCLQDKDRFFITVEDDGKGFDPSDTSPSGMGMDNVRNRVGFLNGLLEIDAAPGEGVTINIELNV